MNKNILNSVPVESQQRNTFDLSHDLKFSFNMGKLVPTTIVDVVPGDSFTIGFENMLRFSALLAPIMHKVKVSTHYFFVPNRILWNNWERWITGAIEVEPPYIIPNNDDPTLPRYGVNKGSLLDYMGIPPFTYSSGTIENAIKINALPIAAYWKIWAEFYMDQNNDPDFEAFSATDAFASNYVYLYDGDNSQNVIAGSSYWTQFDFDCSTRLADRAWQHDYFTSALPWAQKGDDVYIPLSNMPVKPAFNENTNQYNPLVAIDMNGNPTGSGALSIGGSGTLRMNTTVDISLGGQYATNEMDFYEGDGTINNLRRAFALQSWLEKNARGGTRYTESILVHFGVQSSDKRLQRPEYLGGSVQNMVISEVLSTAQTLDSTDNVVNPVGQLAGHGMSVGGSKVLNYYAEEHGWIIGLISVMPDTAYQDGISKKFSRFDRFEYFWPSFQHIGEQGILTKELIASPLMTESEQETIFGYVPRYTEYKYENSRVAGDFRDTLDFWHLGRKFQWTNGDPLPLLNDQFIYPARYAAITEATPFDRIFAVNSDVADTIYCHVLNIIKAKRPMAQYGIPSI